MNHFKLIPLEERIVFDGAAAAHILYVNATAHSGGNGLSWGSAFNDLQTAINTADHLTGSTQIWVAKGTYTPDAVPSNPSSATFLINDSNPLAIYGGFNVGATSLSQSNPASNPTILNGVLSGGGNVDTIVTINAGTITLNGLTISGADNPSGPGGGVLQNSGTLTVSNDTFTNDLVGFAPIDNYGGGIASFNSSLTIINSTFSGDEAWDGAAIAAVGDTTLTINSSLIEHNYASFGNYPNSTDNNGFYGGNSAILANFCQNVTISNSAISNNTGDITGGFTIFDCNNVNFTSNEINNNNNGATSGGGVGGGYITGANNVNISSNIIINNNGGGVEGGGVGALDIEVNTNVTIKSNVIDNNIGGMYAGFGYPALFTAGNGNVSVIDNTFSGNSATGFSSTAGFASEVDNTLIVSGNTFSNNTSVDSLTYASDGGALSVQADTSVTISNNAFIHNTADYGGAIATGLNSALTITNNLFKDNIAYFGGGAISSGATNPAYAGEGDGNVNISQNVFIGNKAGTFGGAVFSQDDTSVTLNQNVFSLNTAASGGAISDASSTALSITNDLFAFNSATQGNSIWLDGGQTTVNGLPLTPQSTLIAQLVDDNVLLFSDDIYIG